MILTLWIIREKIIFIKHIIILTHVVGHERVQTQLEVRRERLLAHLGVGHGRLGLGKHVSRLSLGLSVNVSNLNLSVDVAGCPKLGMDVSKPTLGLGMDVSGSNLDLGVARASPTWGWAWTPLGPTSGLQRQSSLLPKPKRQVAFGLGLCKGKAAHASCGPRVYPSATWCLGCHS